MSRAAATLVSLVLSGLPCLASPTAEAAAARWRDLAGTVFQNYGREQGLPPMVPFALAQDSDGFLWIGAQGGLIRWDGYRFRQFDMAIPGGPGGQAGVWIRALHTDAEGRLWIGTDADGLARYDRGQDRVIPAPMGLSQGGRHHIGAIADDGHGGLWVGADEGLRRLGADGTPTQVFRHDERDPGSLPGDNVQAVLRDRQGRLWVGTDKGLARRDGDAQPFAPVSLPAPGGEVVPVSALLEDRDGRIWIGTEGNGLYVIDPGGAAARAFDGRDGTGWTPRTERVSAIAEAGEHEIWVGLRAAGIAAIDLVTGQVRRIRHDKLVQSSLAHDDVRTMVGDRTGALWIGGDIGLSYHVNDAGTVATVFGDTMLARGVTDPDITAILPSRDGRIWLGFLSGGVDIIDPIAGRVARMRPDSIHPSVALPPDTVTDMAQTGDGEVYLGTVRGLYRADARGRHVTLAAMPGRDPHTNVRALLVDGATLWIGGQDGLWRAPLDHAPLPRSVQAGQNQAAASLLRHIRVYNLARGPAQDIWIGADDGLHRLDVASGALEHIRAEPENPEALPARFVSSVLFDRQGRAWVGTFGGGIAVMVGRDAAGRPRFRRIGVAEGLPLQNVDKLLLDGAGLIWASTDDGLAVIDPTSFRVRAIGRTDGPTLAEYWENSGATDRWGESLFGGGGGLTIARPGWPTSRNSPAPIVVTDVRIAGKPIPAGRFNGASGNLGEAGPLVLTPGTNSLAVEFAALDFTAPERNRYAYRLEGFDRNWTQTDAGRRLAAYTNLPPGKYVLELRGSNHDGVWTQPEIQIPITVRAAWIQTLWAKLALAAIVTAAAVAATAAFVLRRTAYLRERQAELERQIATRTADLRAANERLSELATTDPLTGCANRRHFMDRARELIALGRRGVPMSLAILDLDHFKRINDSFGHPIGDEVLRVASQTSRNMIRVTDLLGRIGGEEFGVLMPNTGSDAALVLAGRLRAAVSEAEVRVGVLNLRVTASLGLAELGEGEDFESLYARADAALYAAKASGRDRVVVAPAFKAPHRQG